MSQQKRDTDDREEDKKYAHPFSLEAGPGEPEVFELERRFEVDEGLDRKGIYRGLCSASTQKG